MTGSSGGSPWDVGRSLELMAGGKVDAGAHIARIGDLDHAKEFLEMVRNQQIDGKAVVYPHRRMDRIIAVSSWSSEDERKHLRLPPAIHAEGGTGPTSDSASAPFRRACFSMRRFIRAVSPGWW